MTDSSQEYGPNMTPEQKRLWDKYAHTPHIELWARLEHLETENAMFQLNKPRRGDLINKLVTENESLKAENERLTIQNAAYWTQMLEGAPPHITQNYVENLKADCDKYQRIAEWLLANDPYYLNPLLHGEPESVVFAWIEERLAADEEAVKEDTHE